MTIPKKEIEARSIERIAENKSIKAGLGVGEWEAMLTPEQARRLIALGMEGFGTWGREPQTIERMKKLYGGKKITVVYSARFEVEQWVDESQDVDDFVSNINPGWGEYIKESFEVLSLNMEPIKPCE